MSKRPYRLRGQVPLSKVAGVSVLKSRDGSYWTADIILKSGAVAYTATRPQQERAYAAALNGASLDATDFKVVTKDSNYLWTIPEREGK